MCLVLAEVAGKGGEEVPLLHCKGLSKRPRAGVGGKGCPWPPLRGHLLAWVGYQNPGRERAGRLSGLAHGGDGLEGLVQKLLYHVLRALCRCGSNSYFYPRIKATFLWEAVAHFCSSAEPQAANVPAQQVPVG